MRILLSLLVWIFAVLPALAQELDQAPITFATDDFQQSLRDLKDSVERLTFQNGELEQKNNQLKALLQQLRIQLGELQQEHGPLAQAAEKLHRSDSTRNNFIGQAQKDLFFAQEQYQKQEANLKILQQALDQKEQEDKQLNEQIAQIQGQPLPIQPDSAEDIKIRQAQKEKLSLMKQIYESKEHQALLQKAVLLAQSEQKNSAYSKALIRRDTLNDQIKSAREQLLKSKTTTEAVSPVQQMDPKSREDLDQLEAEINALKKNHDELEDLVHKMQSKAQGMGIDRVSKEEKEKLEKGINDLKRENQKLKSEFSHLRGEMVELDKRKSKIQNMLDH